MSLEVHFPLHIVIRKPTPDTMEPMVIYGKKSGNRGIGAFNDFREADAVSNGWEPDAEISLLEQPEFAKVTKFFSQLFGITHVVLNPSVDADKAVWIPIQQFFTV